MARDGAGIEVALPTGGVAVEGATDAAEASETGAKFGGSFTPAKETPDSVRRLRFRRDPNEWEGTV